MAELTVALGLFRGADILWLAMESLCRQRRVRFPWELLVLEDGECTGQGVLGYSGRLRRVGCERISYEYVPDRVSYAQKLVHMARAASPHSRCVLLQAADDYSQPCWLVESHEAIAAGADWHQYPKGVFYDIPTGRTYLYDQAHSKSVAGVNLAISTQLLRDAPDEECWRNVHTWLYHSLAPRAVATSISENWEQGFYTAGMNHICMDRRERFAAAPFAPYDVELWVPQDIVKRVEGMRRHVG